MPTKISNQTRLSHHRALRRMVNSPKVLFHLLKDTFHNWRTDNAQRMAAALAYYTIFSIAPTLIIVTTLIDLFVDRNRAEEQILYQTQRLVGTEGTEFVANMLNNTPQGNGGNLLASLIGLATILFAIIGAFGQLQSALNNIWGVQVRATRSTLSSIIRSRLFSIATVITMGFVLLLSLLISTGLAIVDGWLEVVLPEVHLVLNLADFGLSFVVITLLFAVFYKVLPDVHVPWSDVWIGAVVTTVLFNVGKWAIGLYLGSSSLANVFGTAAALVVLLLWVNYSAQIVLFGAEFTQTYATWRGAEIRPAAHAMFVEWSPVETVSTPEKHAPGEAELSPGSVEPESVEEVRQHLSQPTKPAEAQSAVRG